MILTSLLQLLIGLFILGVLVLIHELGHFIAAKLFGIRVISFSVGFGRPLLSRKFGDTEYRISAIPFGGFVHMAGEHPDDSREESPDEFQTKPVWQRAVVALAGPIANYVASIAFLWLLLVSGVRMPVYLLSTRVGDIADSTAASCTGIQPGDSVVAVDGRPVNTWDDMEDAFSRMADGYDIRVIRGGSELDLRFDSMLVNDRGIPRHPTAGLMSAVPTVVGSVTPGYPGQSAGLLAGDTILAADSVSVAVWSVFSRYVAQFDSTRQDSVRLTVKRGDSTFLVAIRPVFDEAHHRPLIGVNADTGPTTVVRMGPIAAVPGAFVRS